MRILMLGNSLTSANGLPGLLAEALEAEVVAHTRGGARLAEQLNSKTRMGARTLAALESERWDFVVLQEMSNAPALFRERYLASSAALCDRVHSAGAVPVIYATWAYAEGSAKLAKTGLSHAEMHALMRDAFAQAAEAEAARLADVGSAFEAHPRQEALYAKDGVHPSPEGTQLTATVLAKACALA